MATSLSLGVAGMHGIVGAGVTTQNTIRYASALGTYAGGGSVVLAVDTRASSPMLKHAAISALLGCGSSVHDAGICPSPLLQFLVRELRAAAGLLIGAGHHPAEWNALIPVNKAGVYATPLEAQSILEIYHSQDFRRASWHEVGSIVPVPSSVREAYVDRLLATIDAEAIRRAQLRAVVDCCNGSGSEVAKSLLSRLGIQYVAINDRHDSFLPHDPEPRPRASVQVRALVRPLEAHVGFVFNSDMTRMALVTDGGETLSEEYTFPFIADHVLAALKEPCTVVTNVSTTRTLDEVVRRHGCVLDRTLVGQAFVLDRMHEIHSPLAGEGCGSVACGKGTYGYDGFLMMALVLEAMATRRARSSELAARLTRFHLVKRKIPSTASRAYTLLHRLRDRFPNAERNEIDGLRFDWDDGWVHIRHSKTEPAIRLIVEWKTTRGAHETAERVRALVEREVAT